MSQPLTFILGAPGVALSRAPLGFVTSRENSPRARKNYFSKEVD